MLVLQNPHRRENFSLHNNSFSLFGAIYFSMQSANYQSNKPHSSLTSVWFPDSLMCHSQVSVSFRQNNNNNFGVMENMFVFKNQP